MSRNQRGRVKFANTRYPLRDRVIFLLSVKAALRAKEIASLTWAMVTDAEGTLSDTIRLTVIASKGRVGRVILINKDLTTLIAAAKAGELDAAQEAASGAGDGRGVPKVKKVVDP